MKSVALDAISLPSLPERLYEPELLRGFPDSRANMAG